MVACRTCELVDRRDRGQAPPWDSILRTPGWDVVHAYGTSIEGWTCLVLRRYVSAVAELTDDEAAELGLLIRSVSEALHQLVRCAKTYVVQFAEQAGHQHVHVHVIPRATDLSDDQQGPRVFSRMGLPEAECVPEDRRNEIAHSLRRELARA